MTLDHEPPPHTAAGPPRLTAGLPQSRRGPWPPVSRLPVPRPPPLGSERTEPPSSSLPRPPILRTPRHRSDRSDQRSSASRTRRHTLHRRCPNSRPDPPSPPAALWIGERAAAIRWAGPLSGPAPRLPVAAERVEPLLPSPPAASTPSSTSPLLGSAPPPPHHLLPPSARLSSRIPASPEPLIDAASEEDGWSAGEIQVSKTGKRNRRLASAQVRIAAPLEAVWNMLTDYEALLTPFLAGPSAASLPLLRRSPAVRSQTLRRAPATW